MAGFFVLEQTEQHRQKAVDRVGVLAFGGDETIDREGVEGPKSQGMPVNEHQSRLTFVCHVDQPN